MTLLGTDVAHAEQDSAHTLPSDNVLVWTSAKTVSVETTDADGNIANATAALGGQLPHRCVLVASDDVRFTVFVGKRSLVTFQGPGRWDVHGDRLTMQLGAMPERRDVKLQFGPRPRRSWPAPSYPEREPPARERRLRLIFPSAPDVRDSDPTVRWRWHEPEPAGRFDLELWKVGSEPTLVERWRGLTGRSHQLWQPLDRGATYRINISVHDLDELAAAATFRVLSKRADAAIVPSLMELNALREREPAVRTEIDILRAWLFESWGLTDEADAVWAALAIDHPRAIDLPRRAR